jgi:hypothetical protein
MVSTEVVSAYSQLEVPCIVEHAGLIFSDYADRSYPGMAHQTDVGHAEGWFRIGDRIFSARRSSL